MRISDWSSDVCSSDLLGDGGDVLLVLLDQVVAHPEAVLRVDRALLGHQVADVAVRRQDGEVLAQVLVARLGLGRRFDDEEALGHRRLGLSLSGAWAEWEPRQYIGVEDEDAGSLGPGRSGLPPRQDN